MNNKINLFDVKNKKVLVTGGTRGLGNKIAEGFLEAGANVVIVGSSPKALEVAESFKNKGYSCHAVYGDLGKKEEIERIFVEATTILKGIDVLVNAHGIQRRHSPLDFPIEDWNDVINVDLTSVFLLSQLAARVMKENGYGKIINIASMISFFGGHTISAYAAAKGGVMQLTKSFSNDLFEYGINVNAIAPGYMATDMTEAVQNDSEWNKEITKRIPAGRWGSGDDLKGCAIFLASAASDYIGGAIIPVDGGFLVK